MGLEVIHTSSEAKWVLFVWEVRLVAEGLFPEVVGVRGDHGADSRRSRVTQKGVRLELAEFRFGKPSASPRQGESAVPPIIDGYRHTVEDHGPPVSFLRRVNNVLRKMVLVGRRRGQRIRLAIELLGNDVNTPIIDTFVPEVTGHFLHPKKAWFC